MPAGRYFRGLTTFDLLGNLVPGVVLLAAALISLPDPPSPSSPAHYLLFGVLAFSLGQFLQRYASAASGDRRSFDRTIDAARQQGRGPDDSDDRADIDSEDPSDDERRPIRSAFGTGLAALADPIFWPWRSSRGTVLDERIVANLAWKHLRDTYEISPGTENYDVLVHLMSSELDDVTTPSRAVRFQAIRNFHRGMWMASWLVGGLWTLVLLADCVLHAGSSYAGITYHSAWVVATWSPAWLLAVVLAVLAFRSVAELYQAEFVKYLFTDFVVATMDDENSSEEIARLLDRVDDGQSSAGTSGLAS